MVISNNQILTGLALNPGSQSCNLILYLFGPNILGTACIYCDRCRAYSKRFRY